MNESHFDWDNLRLFLAVAREGGLGPAAAVTGKSPPTLGRRMLALERALGRDLFRRLPRGYALTEDGQALLERAMALEAGLAPLVEDASATSPLVKISAGTWVTRLICQHVDDLIGNGPCRLRLIADEHKLDIGRREAMMGIRNTRPEGIGLAGRRIGSVRFAVYAVDDSVETWARVLADTPSARWLRDTLDDAPAIEVTSPKNALDLTLSGATRAVLPTFIGDGETTLTRVTPCIEALEHEQWLVTHHEDRYISEMRQVIDRVYALLKRLI